ncbi:MAG: LytTR family DNA-binding domain-containing protein [Bacteroidia bacterium]|jgi:DNA-binding LytR/AlgR family response regulator|nr:LytTR family DNA-binding domain-containing protein [Bacteroidia bacterium]
MRCLIVDDDELIRIDIENRLSQLPGFTLVASCGSATEAAAVLMREPVDVIFLDVQLPKMNGLEFLRTLDQRRPKIIMMTSNKEYAAEAFEYEVNDFLVKPFSDERFMRSLMRLQKSAETTAAPASSPASDHVFVKVNGLLEKVSFSDITYIEAMSDYIQIHAAGRKLVVHSTMKNLEQSLPAHEFFRVHNSFLVRLDSISRIDDNALIVDGKAIPVSRSKMKPLMERLKVL